MLELRKVLSWCVGFDIESPRWLTLTAILTATWRNQLVVCPKATENFTRVLDLVSGV